MPFPATKLCRRNNLSRRQGRANWHSNTGSTAAGGTEILNEAEKGLVQRDVGRWLYQFLDEPTTEI